MSQKFITPLVSDVDWKTKVLDAEPTCLAVVEVRSKLRTPELDKKTMSEPVETMESLAKQPMLPMVSANDIVEGVVAP